MLLFIRIQESILDTENVLLFIKIQECRGLGGDDTWNILLVIYLFVINLCFVIYLKLFNFVAVKDGNEVPTKKPNVIAILIDCLKFSCNATAKHCKYLIGRKLIPQSLRNKKNSHILYPIKNECKLFQKTK